MATVVTVLKSGGEYGPEHVYAMQRQVRRWAPPDTEFLCLSDVLLSGVECVALGHDFPGWWAKLEVFRPWWKGDFLYTDLDNIFVGPMDDLLKPRSFTLQRGGWTALMSVPQDIRRPIWDAFIAAPEKWMKKFDRAEPPYDNAGFISSFGHPLSWEDVLPGQVVNVASMLQPMFLRTTPNMYLRGAEARVILCEGEKRRPWKLSGFEREYWCQEAI